MSGVRVPLRPPIYQVCCDCVAGGNVTFNYASTIHRDQGATVDQAHVILNDRTNNRQLYVAAARGRRANHIHRAPPAQQVTDFA